MFRFLTTGFLVCWVGAWFPTAPAWGQEKKPAKADPDLEELVRGNNEFAFDLYAQLSKKPGNVFFSPYSISTALGMTYAGARGNTAKEMANSLFR